ncbi:MAG: hypothetical protein WAN72_17275, partial [Candidatus Acidiferrales bacterium]
GTIHRDGAEKRGWRGFRLDFRYNITSAITNRSASLLIFRQRFTARVFLSFLGRQLRLTSKTRRKWF